MFVGLECQAQLWTIKADTLTADSSFSLDDHIGEGIRRVVAELVRSREIRPDSLAGPVYYAWYDLHFEPRSRELAAGLHAALYGDLGPLTRAVPQAL